MNNILVGSDSFAYYETLAGGQGGRPGRAGQSAIHTGMTNTKNTPIESLEGHYPIRVTRYELRRESGGEGRFPGGEGLIRRLEFLEPAVVSLLGERRVIPPWGLQGGRPGAVGADWLIRPGAAAERLPGKVTFDVSPGDSLVVETPGGGGWGSALVPGSVKLRGAAMRCGPRCPDRLRRGQIEACGLRPLWSGRLKPPLSCTPKDLLRVGSFYRVPSRLSVSRSSSIYRYHPFWPRLPSSVFRLPSSVFRLGSTLIP